MVVDYFLRTARKRNFNGGCVFVFCACGTKMLEAQQIKVIKLRIILYRIGSPDFIKYGSQTKVRYQVSKNDCQAFYKVQRYC